MAVRLAEISRLLKMTYDRGGSPHHRLLAVRLALFVVAAYLAVGCSGDPDPPRITSQTHLDGAGPLSAPVISGGRSIYAPHSGPRQWPATFGSVLLCTPRNSDNPVLNSVRYEEVVKPLGIKTVIRNVPNESTRNGKGDWAPILSRIGTPTAFWDAPRRARGRMEPVQGQIVDTACTTSADIRYIELVTTMVVSRYGGRIDAILIDYGVGDQAYTWRVARASLMRTTVPSVDSN